MDEHKRASALKEAGIDLLGAADPATPLIPPSLAGFASSCPAEGVADCGYLRSDDPRILDKTNAEWYRISLAGGLFPKDEAVFLLAVNYAEIDERPDWRWARVKLSDQWDVAGAGAATGLVGNGFGRPSFVMLSADGNTVVRAQQGEEATEIVLVRDPHRVRFFRKLAAQMSRWPDTPELTKDALARWLTATEE